MTNVTQPLETGVAAEPAETKLSLVTISFNQVRFLEECLRSVLEQGLPGVEYIVVDAGSSDSSREIIERYAHRLTAKIFERDRGPADGLNKGFGRATGNVFGYVNSDDRLVPGALAYVKRYFDEHPHVDVLCSAIRIIDEKGRRKLRSRIPDAFDLADYASGICTVGQQATFFRRQAFEAVGGFNIDNRICWDGELLVDMALNGVRFATDKRVLGDFRIYPGTLTGSGAFRSPEYGAIRKRLAEKIRARGARLHSPAKERVLQLAYRANLLRHVRYLMA